MTGKPGAAWACPGPPLPQDAPPPRNCPGLSPWPWSTGRGRPTRQGENQGGWGRRAQELSARSPRRGRRSFRSLLLGPPFLPPQTGPRPQDGRGAPSTPAHLAQTTAFQALAERGGTCFRPGPGCASCSARAPLPGSSPGRGWKRESGKAERKYEKKERGRVNRPEAAREEQHGARRGSGGGGAGGRLRARAGRDHVPALAPGRHPAPPAAARAPQVSACLRRAGAPLAIAGRPTLARQPQQRADAGGGGGFTCRQDLHHGLGSGGPRRAGDLRRRQISEVHAQTGNLPDLYTGACVVRQREKQLYLAGIPVQEVV